MSTFFYSCDFAPCALYSKTQIEDADTIWDRPACGSGKEKKKKWAHVPLLRNGTALPVTFHQPERVGQSSLTSVGEKYCPLPGKGSIQTHGEDSRYF